MTFTRLISKPIELRGKNQGILRYYMGRGVCRWCGKKTRVYQYRIPGYLDYRLPPWSYEGGFCNQSCYRDYTI